MVQFISESVEESSEEPAPEEEESVSSADESLEQLVEEQEEELAIREAEIEYFNEAAEVSGEYFAPPDIEIKEGTELKHELKPLIYEDNEEIKVVDIFEKYGQKDENNWWKHRTNY